ncbi:uncharacterized protein CLUP02_03012 [Colletotrichum lupini]|uniref:Uncharacterized protein n=1 Tax=Colletotrichum lupini TaxID=145971 RepID=A0A9Q8WBS7_9PEZI|nr:uncharacterized protein CLUP02_03012 [Colletotrichum lupini]UQC77544.1 hypothetical protein CLUP02_03012 [Colletotrichum lupini]
MGVKGSSSWPFSILPHGPSRRLAFLPLRLLFLLRPGSKNTQTHVSYPYGYSVQIPRESTAVLFTSLRHNPVPMEAVPEEAVCGQLNCHESLTLTAITKQEPLKSQGVEAEALLLIVTPRCHGPPLINIKPLVHCRACIDEARRLAGLLEHLAPARSSLLLDFIITPSGLRRTRFPVITATLPSNPRFQSDLVSSPLAFCYHLWPDSSEPVLDLSPATACLRWNPIHLALLYSVNGARQTLHQDTLLRSLAACSPPLEHSIRPSRCTPEHPDRMRNMPAVPESQTSLSWFDTSVTLCFGLPLGQPKYTSHQSNIEPAPKWTSGTDGPCIRSVPLSHQNPQSTKTSQLSITVETSRLTDSSIPSNRSVSSFQRAMAQSGVPQLKRLGNDGVKLQSTSPTLRIHGPKVKKSTNACYATLRSMPECAAVVDLSFITSKLRFPVQTTPPVNWPSTLIWAISYLSSGAARPCFALPRLKLVSLLRLLTFLPGATCRRSWYQPTGSTDGRSALALSRDSTVRDRDFVHFHFVFLQWTHPSPTTGRIVTIVGVSGIVGTGDATALLDMHASNNARTNRNLSSIAASLLCRKVPAPGRYFSDDFIHGLTYSRVTLSSQSRRLCHVLPQVAWNPCLATMEPFDITNSGLESHISPLEISLKQSGQEVKLKRPRQRVVRPPCKCHSPSQRGNPNRVPRPRSRHPYSTITVRSRYTFCGSIPPEYHTGTHPRVLQLQAPPPAAHPLGGWMPASPERSTIHLSSSGQSPISMSGHSEAQTERRKDGVAQAIKVRLQSRRSSLGKYDFCPYGKMTVENYPFVSPYSVAKLGVFRPGCLTRNAERQSGIMFSSLERLDASLELLAALIAVSPNLHALRLENYVHVLAPAKKYGYHALLQASTHKIKSTPGMGMPRSVALPGSNNSHLYNFDPSIAPKYAAHLNLVLIADPDTWKNYASICRIAWDSTSLCNRDGLLDSASAADSVKDLQVIDTSSVMVDRFGQLQHPSPREVAILPSLDLLLTATHTVYATSSSSSQGRRNMTQIPVYTWFLDEEDTVRSILWGTIHADEPLHPVKAASCERTKVCLSAYHRWTFSTEIMVDMINIPNNARLFSDHDTVERMSAAAFDAAQRVRHHPLQVCPTTYPATSACREAMHAKNAAYQIRTAPAPASGHSRTVSQERGIAGGVSDAWCDFSAYIPRTLQYLFLSFEGTSHSAVGTPSASPAPMAYAPYAPCSVPTTPDPPRAATLKLPPFFSPSFEGRQITCASEEAMLFDDPQLDIHTKSQNAASLRPFIRPLDDH